jgi:hypothetical protein
MFQYDRNEKSEARELKEKMEALPKMETQTGAPFLARSLREKWVFCEADTPIRCL